MHRNAMGISGGDRGSAEMPMTLVTLLIPLTPPDSTDSLTLLIH